MESCSAANITVKESLCFGKVFLVKYFLVFKTVMSGGVVVCVFSSSFGFKEVIVRASIRTEMKVLFQ